MTDPRMGGRTAIRRFALALALLVFGLPAGLIFDNNMYLSCGFNGIMGDEGMIGSPLDRPYLHYTYNLIVFVPMLIAIWDEARHMDRVDPAATGEAA
jgi:hypothetical protein